MLPVRSGACTGTSLNGRSGRGTFHGEQNQGEGPSPSFLSGENGRAPSFFPIPRRWGQHPGTINPCIFHSSGAQPSATPNPQQSSAEPINTGSSLLKTKRLSTLCFLSTNTLIFLLYWQRSQSKVLSQHFFGFFSHFLLPLPHQTTALLKCLTEILRGLPGNTQLPQASQAKVKANDLLGSPSLMFYIHIHTRPTHIHTYIRHASCHSPPQPIPCVLPIVHVPKTEKQSTTH